ncbi:MAG: hypothetical protein AVDCRST_MAG10-110, partial [uncultured Acidimicrobiales bacterium]
RGRVSAVARGGDLHSPGAPIGGRQSPRHLAAGRRPLAALGL